MNESAVGPRCARPDPSGALERNDKFDFSHQIRTCLSNINDIVTHSLTNLTSSEVMGCVRKRVPRCLCLSEASEERPSPLVLGGLSVGTTG